MPYVPKNNKDDDKKDAHDEETTRKRSKTGDRGASLELRDIDVDNVFHLVVLQDKIKVPPHRLDARYNVYVADMLRGRYFNVCSKYGYVRDGHLELLHIANPLAQLSHLNGDCCCNVLFKVWTCNPAVGSHVRGTVVKSNKFGILVAAGPLRCVLTRNAVSNVLRSDESALDALDVGDRVVVKILGVRYENMDTTLVTVGILATEQDLEVEMHDLRGNILSAQTAKRTAERQTKAANEKTTKTVFISKRVAGEDYDNPAVAKKNEDEYAGDVDDAGTEPDDVNHDIIDIDNVDADIEDVNNDGDAETADGDGDGDTTIADGDDEMNVGDDLDDDDDGEVDGDDDGDRDGDDAHSVVSMGSLVYDPYDLDIDVIPDPDDID